MTWLCDTKDFLEEKALGNVTLDEEHEKVLIEVIEEHPDRYIHTPSWTVNMPSVVRHLRYIPRDKSVKFSRNNVYLRDKGRCQYCGKRVPRDSFTYDHVIPRVQGGQTTWNNVVVACSGSGSCNQRKGGRTPDQAKMKLRCWPVRPKSLPNVGGFMKYRPGMPESWKQYLRDVVYWDAELENDNALVVGVTLA